jgi:tRNA (guanine26-N2/guanine27-N2)-dimethyltransferase
MELEKMEERGSFFFASKQEEPDSDMGVFFNDHMVENRDLSEAAFRLAAKRQEMEEVHTLDATAASGIRGFRYADFSDQLVLNDWSTRDALEKGAEANNLKKKVENLELTFRDANELMSTDSGRFHLLDVDPYGPFTPFLDSAARASNHNSFVGFTATDVAVAAGSYPKTCRRRYGSRPLKNSFMHETALRIYIHEVFRNYARFDKAFEPKLCFQKRHYCRVMGRVTESKSRCNGNLENTGFLTFCPECRWRKLERKETCENCGNEEVEHAGPLWTGKTSDSRFTEELLDQFPEDWEDSAELLQLLHGEAELSKPFYSIHELASCAGVSSPRRDELLQEIEEIGYPVARSHFDPQGFKTTMPVDQLLELVEEKSS